MCFYNQQQRDTQVFRRAASCEKFRVLENWRENRNKIMKSEINSVRCAQRLKFKDYETTKNKIKLIGNENAANQLIRNVFSYIRHIDHNVDGCAAVSDCRWETVRKQTIRFIAFSLCHRNEL